MRINTRVGMCVIMVGLLGLGCTTLSSFITGLTGTGSGGGLQDIGAAIAAAFSGGGNTQSAAVVPASGVSSTCSDFQNQNSGSAGIEMSASITAGTYGPKAASVTVTAADDCEDDNTSTSAYAAFTITQDISASCDDGTTITLMPGSTGVFRNDDVQKHFPEIYGTFNVRDSDGTEYAGIRCAIILGEQENVISATCEDSAGNAIATNSSTVTCQFNTN